MSEPEWKLNLRRRERKLSRVNDGFRCRMVGTSAIRNLALQTDGKILLSGAFSEIEGQPRKYIARLNPDGSLDSEFSPQSDYYFDHIALQTDGKILVCGRFSEIEGQSRKHIARLNPDGSLDSEFSFDPQSDGYIDSLTLQSDGKILVDGLFSRIEGQRRKYFARLNSDGSLDRDFKPGSIFDDCEEYGYGCVTACVLQQDGKILVGSLLPQIVRLNPNGSLDKTIDIREWSSVAYSLALQPDGKILVSVRSGHIIRFNPDGSLDTTFTTSASPNAHTVVVQPDGKILICTFTDGISCLNTIGVPDTVFGDRTSRTWYYCLALQPDGKILCGGVVTQPFDEPFGRPYLARYHPDGSLDATLTTGVGSHVHTVAVQPDGKILVGGIFSSIGEEERSHFGRLHPNGDVDSFRTAYTLNGDVHAIALLSRGFGNTLFAGDFSISTGPSTGSAHVALFGSEGGCDTSFNVRANDRVFALALQTDGKILLGGEFTEIGGEPIGRIARLVDERTSDTDRWIGHVDRFNPNANGDVYQLVVQPDRKILVSGAFTEIGYVSQTYVARLDPDDGKFDDKFEAELNDKVNALALQPDGKILVGGQFTEIARRPRAYIARLHPDGSLDASFTADSNGPIFCFALQTDGKILVGGAFTEINGESRRYFARLNPDGSLDDALAEFFNNPVYTLALQPDGKVVMGGSFKKAGIPSVERKYIARLSVPEAALQELTAAPDGHSITWLRSGAGPEVRRVVFEGDDNYNFNNPIALGPGTRITGGWKLTGLNLPREQLYYIRARGYYSSSHSVSWVESTRQVYLTGP